jgi:hypothetical protein
MYIRDFPKKTGKAGGKLLCPFAQSLLMYLKAQDLPKDIWIKLYDFDFVGSHDIQLVYSMSGNHVNPAERQGMNGLATAIQKLQLQVPSERVLELGYLVLSCKNVNEKDIFCGGS